MINIAIDGPAGAGKSTLAKGLAEKLGFIYVDTGALYRTVGLKFSNLSANADDDAEVEKVLSKTEIDLKFIDGVQCVFLDGENVNDKIRTPKASMMASKVSAKPKVRAFLLNMQRKIAQDNNAIMDGRDIGTVVLPNADIKIFLTADNKIRAKRRYEELIQKGEKVEYDDVLRDLEQRDYNDSHREIAPLKPAKDSILFDTTNYNLEQSVNELYKIINERLVK